MLPDPQLAEPRGHGRPTVPAPPLPPPRPTLTPNLMGSQDLPSQGRGAGSPNHVTSEQSQSRHPGQALGSPFS